MHPNSGSRRRHSDELKARVLAACDEPGASISGVALAHGLNTNLVRKWRSGRGFKVAGVAASKAPPPSLGSSAGFIAIEIPAPAKAAASQAAAAPVATPSADPIQVELRRGALHLNVRWPVAAANDCLAWLRELSSGLLK